jgi:hypothetical protein
MGRPILVWSVRQRGSEPAQGLAAGHPARTEAHGFKSDGRTVLGFAAAFDPSQKRREVGLLTVPPGGHDAASFLEGDGDLSDQVDHVRLLAFAGG